MTRARSFAPIASATGLADVSSMDWLNWGGWRWIVTPLAMLIGFYIGWDARGFRARLDASLTDFKLLRLAMAARAFIAHQKTDEADRRRVDLHAAIDAALSERKVKQ